MKSVGPVPQFKPPFIQVLPDFKSRGLLHRLLPASSLSDVEMDAPTRSVPEGRLASIWKRGQSPVIPHPEDIRTAVRRRPRSGRLLYDRDGHATYWNNHRDIQYSLGDFARDLVDYMHAPYWSASASRDFNQDSRKRVLSVRVPQISRLIESVSVTDSIMTIRKTLVPKDLPVCTTNA